MYFRSLVWHGALVGLLGLGTCAPNLRDTCPDGIAIVELQPYEIVCDMPGISVITGTRTTTRFPSPRNTDIIIPGGSNNQGHYDEWPKSPGSNHPDCLECVTVTKTVQTPFCKTIPAATKGGVPTVVIGVLPPCEKCMTVTTTGPKPFITTVNLGNDVPTVMICEGPHTSQDIVTTDVPGPTPGTSTILPPMDCSTECTTTIRVTTVPLGRVTTKVPGPTPGTSTIPPGPDCTTDCTTTIRVTTVPPGIVTSKVPGPTPGTSIIPPASDCSVSCTTTIRITTVPPPVTFPIDTTTVPGSTPGTTTIPPASDCSTDCTTHVRVTAVPTPSSSNNQPPTSKRPTPSTSPTTTKEPPTSSPSSTEPSTTREPPTSSSTSDKPPMTSEPTTLSPTSSIPSTTSESPTSSPSSIGPSTTSEPTTSSTSTSEEPTSTTPVPSNACAFPSGTCDPSSLNADLYANSISPTEGYGVSDGESGVGPDYYLSQQSLAQGSTTTLFMPYGDNEDGGTGQTTPGSPNFNYFPGLTKTFAGITFNANNFTLVFLGYFVPPTTGSYEFCTNVDNRDAVYIGSDSAFPCGDPSNSATPRGATPLVEYWFFRDNTTQCANVDMVQGYYYPFRSVYGNWGSPSVMTTTVKGPGDSDASSDFSGKVAPDTCSA
ncbi:PA14 domain protein [Fusarium beomiforme]|uniref:PA14 domain protein n=1 Tax=Fusarium beomiforme TaxID=44412 RepID=A0A9P5AMW6_9HYPO|nr:PA14 domain protein [Fusarium beomiforme]